LLCPASMHAVTAAAAPSAVMADPCGRAAIVFRMTSASGTVEALQLDVDYSAAGGEFLGSGGSVECVRLASGAGAANDDDAAKTLTLGNLFLSGANAPMDLWRCSYATSGGVLPDAGDFAITITDATSPAGDPLDVTVTISDIQCDSGCDSAPRSDCRAATASVLQIKDDVDDAKDKVSWKWKKGAAIEIAAISDPTT